MAEEKGVGGEKTQGGDVGCTMDNSVIRVEAVKKTRIVYPTGVEAVKKTRIVYPTGVEAVKKTRIVYPTGVEAVKKTRIVYPTGGEAVKKTRIVYPVGAEAVKIDQQIKGSCTRFLHSSVLVSALFSLAGCSFLCFIFISSLF